MQLRHLTMDPHLRAAGIEMSEQEHLRRVRLRFECAQLVLVADKPGGLLKLARDGRQWILIQLQIVPELQGCGLGARLLQQVIAEATEAGASIALDVLKSNPARRLYERFGFVVAREGVHSFDMRRPASP